MKLNPEDLGKITDLTLEYYNRNAEEFWEGTRAHDVSQNIEALLRYIEGEPPFTILDFGCGPGRDLKECSLNSATLGGRLGRCLALRRNGACPQRLRSMAAGFPQARSAG